MMAAITERELSMTAADRLARNLAFCRPLSVTNVDDIIDQRLADGRDEFVLMGDPWIAADGTLAYRYCGTRWAVEYRNGRPHLIEAINVPADSPGPEVAAAEQAFAVAIHFTEGLFGRPMGEERIAELRGDPWGDVFRRAAERDARAGGGDGTQRGDRDDDLGEGGNQ